MAKRDKIHEAIQRALEKDGWIILADPYILATDDVRSEVDLESGKVVELDNTYRKILVEIKSFTRQSLFPDFFEAFGQYVFYRDGVDELELDYNVYLAISTVTLFRFSRQPTVLRRIAKHNIKLIIVDLKTETIVRWIE